MLSNRLKELDARFILCGHSLGARVIYYALSSLSNKNMSIIQDVHLLGGAVGNTSKDWQYAKKAVIGKINNYMSNNDDVLKYLYRTSTIMQSNPIGISNIDVEGINNVDVTKTITGHTKYKCNFAEIVKLQLETGSPA